MSIIAEPQQENTDSAASVAAKIPRRWISLAVLALLPVVVAIVFYHPPAGLGHGVDFGPDSQFYIYQIGRVAEEYGAWWRLADDPRVGAPYATGAAKNPGMYEGLDVVPAAAIAGQWLSPRSTFIFVSLFVLAFNGWVVGWLTERLTGSLWAAALAIVLVTVNQPTLCRYGEHLHLFKYGWVLLTIWAFSRYLDTPSMRRGAILGLAAAATLVASFHFGYFLGLALGVWWLSCQAARKLNEEHVKAAVVAAAVGGLFAALGTFPVWTAQAGQTQAKLYHQRDAADLWRFSSELWQYVVRPKTAAADSRLKASGRDIPPAFASLTDHPFDQHVRQVQRRYGDAWGGWYYLGWSMLAGLVGFVMLRVQGHRFGLEQPAILDRMAGLFGLFVLLSLSGGPGALLYDVFPQFRCYGRAGLLALPLAAVLTAVTANAVVKLSPTQWKKWLVVVAVSAVLIKDVRVTERLKIDPIPNAPPGWSVWLADQPADVRLAAFPASAQMYCFGEIWHWQSLALGLTHRHATLNGAEFAMFQADLKLLGSDFYQLSPAGLRFVATLGYNTFAFEDAMVERSPWLNEISWLQRTAQLSDGWSIWQASADVPSFPTATRADLLKNGVNGTRRVPAETVVTLPLDVSETTVATDAAVIESAWVDEGGTAGPWSRVLEQRVYGPGLAAIVTQSPAAGLWRLQFRDADTHAVLAEQAVQVLSGLPKSDEVPASALAVKPLERFADGGCVVRLQNTTDRYLVARRDGQPASHPVLTGVQPGTTFVLLRTRIMQDIVETPLEARILLPCDLPPRSDVQLMVPAGTFGPISPPGSEIVAAYYVAPNELRPTPRATAEVVVEVHSR